MIGCDGPSCAVKWFHFSCAGIERGVYQRENGSVQRASFLDTVNTVADSVGNLICIWHIRRSLSQGLGNLFTFCRGLDRIKGPCMWGIITVWFCLMANAPYFPGVGEVGVYIDRCIINI